MGSEDYQPKKNSEIDKAWKLTLDHLRYALHGHDLLPVQELPQDCIDKNATERVDDQLGIGSDRRICTHRIRASMHVRTRT